MRPGQVILIVASVALVFVIYSFGSLLPPDKTNPQETGAVASAGESAFDFEAYKSEQLKKLPADALKKYELLQTEVQAAADKAGKLNEVATLFEANNLNILAEFSKKDAAAITNQDSVWEKSGKGLYAAAYTADNPLLTKYVLAQAIACYEKALELNPDNEDAKISLAVAYLEGQSEPMKGVMLLREITDKDPDNITANLILGKYGIVSGQFDKAVQRFEKVLAVDSLNADAYLYLSQAYESLGEKEKAIEMLVKCRSLVRDPAFANDINKYIDKLKNS
ncbi:MAG: tetratricopeptide repeat protein [Chitinophagales bacterium]|nr:tetratricopeptide repeat protein [Chitinophagales bacterium]